MMSSGLGILASAVPLAEPIKDVLPFFYLFFYLQHILWFFLGISLSSYMAHLFLPDVPIRAGGIIITAS